MFHRDNLHLIDDLQPPEIRDALRFRSKEREPMSQYYLGATEERRAVLAEIDRGIADAERLRAAAEDGRDSRVALAQWAVINRLRSLRLAVTTRAIGGRAPEVPPGDEPRDADAWALAQRCVAATGKKQESTADVDPFA